MLQILHHTTYHTTLLTLLHQQRRHLTCSCTSSCGELRSRINIGTAPSSITTRVWADVPDAIFVNAHAASNWNRYTNIDHSKPTNQPLMCNHINTQLAISWWLSILFIHQSNDKSGLDRLDYRRDMITQNAFRQTNDPKHPLHYLLLPVKVSQSQMVLDLHIHISFHVAKLLVMDEILFHTAFPRMFNVLNL